MTTPKRHPNFKGRSVIASHGYTLVYVGKSHHLADVRGYAYEHRIVAEKKLGRRLRKGEVIHHINEKKRDNRPENIEVLKNNSVHLNQHRKVGMDRQRFGQSNPMIVCECGCKKSFRKFDALHRPRRFIPGHARKGKGRGNPSICCACGCGKTFLKYDAAHRERRFIPGHNMPLQTPALTVIHPTRILPPPSKVWDRGAMFQGWELDLIQSIAKQGMIHRSKLIRCDSEQVLKILSTKKI